LSWPAGERATQVIAGLDSASVTQTVLPYRALLPLSCGPWQRGDRAL